MLRSLAWSIGGGWLYTYSIVWLNEELLLVLSFLLFCFMVNKIVGADFIEFVASRNVQIQQHAFVIAKQYLLRDLKIQKENQQLAGLVVTQTIKVFLMQTASDIARLEHDLKLYKMQAVSATVRDVLTSEHVYIDMLVVSAADSIRTQLETKLVFLGEFLFKENLFKLYSVNLVSAFYVLMSTICVKIK